MHAVEVPLLKLTLVAAGALAVAAFVPHHHHHRTTHRLVLHTRAEKSNELFLSAWMDNREVKLELDRSHLHTMQFETRADVSDGCRWVSTESLVPNGDHFDYFYEDHIVSCQPDATPALPTPHVGTVTIDQ
jgi:hypothetical protein